MSSTKTYTSHFVEKYYSKDQNIYFNEDYTKKIYEVSNRNPFFINYEDDLIGIKFFDVSGELYNEEKTSGQPCNYSKMYYLGKRYKREDLIENKMTRELKILDECKIEEIIICYNESIILNYNKEDVCMNEIKEKLGKEYIDSIRFDRIDFYNGLISAFQIFHEGVYGIIEDKRYNIDKSNKNISIIEGNRLAFITSYNENIENGKVQKSKISLDECLKVFDKISQNYPEFESVKEYSCLLILGKEDKDIEKILYDSAIKAKECVQIPKTKTKKYMY